MEWADGVYEGVVVEIKPRKLHFKVQYDDGDMQWELYDPIRKCLVNPDE